ncbi:MAG: hypothetical protein IJO66_01345 [Clostridia bacterium]|nr:hypothetical protein [Clostridia bacterium]MBR0206438.1 hypothetical protein [Clostridia bacterium]
MNQNRPDCPAGPPSPPPHPLTCALVLAEQVRAERGRLGVEQYVRCVGPLLPPPLAEEMSRRLGVPLPPPPPPPGPPPPPNKKPPENGGLDMQQLLRIMSCLGRK